MGSSGGWAWTFACLSKALKQHVRNGSSTNCLTIGCGDVHSCFIAFDKGCTLFYTLMRMNKASQVMCNILPSFCFTLHIWCCSRTASQWLICKCNIRQHVATTYFFKCSLQCRSCEENSVVFFFHIAFFSIFKECAHITFNGHALPIWNGTLHLHWNSDSWNWESRNLTQYYMLVCCSPVKESN